MASKTTIRCRAVVRLALGVLLAVAAVTTIPRPAVAQDSQVRELTKQATNDYDTLKIKQAEQKLEEAIRIGESQGASGSAIAKAYVMLAVVRYGATRKKEAALNAFKKALKNDPDAEVPSVYQTPTLSKLMKKAKEAVGPPSGGGSTSQGPGAGPKREVDEFTHEPIASAQAGEKLLVEAFVPTDMPASSVYFIFKRYNQNEWQQAKLKATNATRFATEVDGYRIYTSQISYYLEAVDSSGNVLARSGEENRPHNITVLGSSSFDHEAAKKKAMARKRRQQEQKQKEKRQKRQDETDRSAGGKKGGSRTDAGAKGEGRDGPVAYLDFGGGTAFGFLPGGTPTANPTREVQPGIAPAFGHLRLGGGYIFENTAQLGIYIRWQFSPVQNFAEIRKQNPNRSYSGFADGECLGTGLSGDCLLGVKYRWFFTRDKSFRVYSSVGGGFGRVRHWLRLKEDANSSFCNNRETIEKPSGKSYCYRRDTVRPGWLHFGVGGGFAWDFNETVGLLGEAYLQVLFPDTAINLDITLGPQFRF